MSPETEEKIYMDAQDEKAEQRGLGEIAERLRICSLESALTHLTDAIREREELRRELITERKNNAALVRHLNLQIETQKTVIMAYMNGEQVAKGVHYEDHL